VTQPRPQTQDTTAAFPSALPETVKAYELAFGACLRTDHLLLRLSLFAQDPSDLNRQLLAEHVGRTLTAVHAVLEAAHIPAVSRDAFARCTLTDVALVALETSPGHPPTTGDAACPHCGRVRACTFDGDAIRCMGCWHRWIPQAPQAVTP
jgi:hypothetical protein